MSRITVPLPRLALAIIVAAVLCGPCAKVARAAASTDQVPAPATLGRKHGSPLRFNRDGLLRIVQITDVHSARMLDPRVSADIGRILDSQRPDFVVVTGDIVTDDCRTPAELRRAVGEICRPMVSRRIPWAAVLGNHDAEQAARVGVTKAQLFAMYREQAFNGNPPDPTDVYGAGNGLLMIPGSRGNKPALGIWLLDSNANAPATIAGQKLGADDWIHVSQIAWYYDKSRSVEKRLGHKLPALMFFHICLPEFVQMADTRPLVGDRDDRESPSRINSGMFAALLDRGDVLGVYVGHDHYNNYEGNYFGVRLGYGGAIKFASHRADPSIEPKLNLSRGARVFVIDERDPAHYETHYVHVRDLK